MLFRVKLPLVEPVSVEQAMRPLRHRLTQLSGIDGVIMAVQKGWVDISPGNRPRSRDVIVLTSLKASTIKDHISIIILGTG